MPGEPFFSSYPASIYWVTVMTECWGIKQEQSNKLWNTVNNSKLLQSFVDNRNQCQINPLPTRTNCVLTITWQYCVVVLWIAEFYWLVIRVGETCLNILWTFIMLFFSENNWWTYQDTFRGPYAGLHWYLHQGNESKWEQS
jgi:hypothetical protein